MGFDLEDDVIFGIEFNDTCVVFKDAHAPIAWSEHLSDFFGRGEDRLFEHARELSRSVFVLVLNSATQRFMAAVFAPSLSDGFELDVGRFAAQASIVVLDRLHFRQ